MKSLLLLIPLALCLATTGCYRAAQESQRPNEATQAMQALDARSQYLQAREDARLMQRQLVTNQWVAALDTGHSIQRRLELLLGDPELDPQLKALVRLLPPTVDATVMLIERQELKAMKMASNLLAQFDQVSYNLVSRGWIPPEEGGGGGGPIPH